MMKIIRYISVLIAAFLVLSLTIGTHISKMKCDEGGILYFGSDVPSCSLQKEMICNVEQEKVYCCMMEIQKTCCPETEDKSCASETEILHFDFETLVHSSVIDFSVVAGFFLLKTNYYRLTSLQLSRYTSGIPPPKINKPILSQIQSFLL